VFLLKMTALILVLLAAHHALADPKPGGELIISVGTGPPRSLNSAVASGYSTIMISTQIFASPLRYDEHWNPQPYLARDWNISKDGLSVTLHLMDGATFHDGYPVTSEDVAFSIMTVKEYSPFKDAMAPVERVDTPDRRTVIVHLQRPHPAILMAMSPLIMPVLPKHIYGDGQDVRKHPANVKPVGSGPFRFAEYIPEKQVVLERNERFFIPGRPYLDRIVFRIENDVSVQMLGMERQEIQLLPLFVDPEGESRLDRNHLFAITARGYEGAGAISWVEFNLLRKPVDDKRVRQAIAYAADRKFITDFLHRGQSRIATGPIIPDSPFYEGNVPLYEMDLGKANLLLDEAGYPKKSDGKRFALTLDYPDLLPSQLKDVALYLRDQLAKIGIDVRTRRWDNFQQWMNHVANWEFDMTMNVVSNYGDPVIGVQRTYLSGNIKKGVMFTNCSNYRSPKVDELLTQAGAEMDSNKRKSLYREFQQIVTEDLPILWMNVVPFRTVYNAGLRNLPMSIWGVFAPLDEIYWETPPWREFSTPPNLDEQDPLLKQVAVHAIHLLREQGLDSALEIFKDPSRGFLDLAGSGLHVVGFTTDGFAFLDNSGQMKPGMTIGGILDLEGNRLLAQLLAVARGKNGGWFSSTGTLPHPVSHRAGPMSAWCGLLREMDVVCAIEWGEE